MKSAAFVGSIQGKEGSKAHLNLMSSVGLDDRVFGERELAALLREVLLFYTDLFSLFGSDQINNVTNYKKKLYTSLCTKILIYTWQFLLIHIIGSIGICVM